MTTLDEDQVKEATRGITEEYLTWGPEYLDLAEYVDEYYLGTDDDDKQAVAIAVRKLLDTLIDNL